MSVIFDFGANYGIFGLEIAKKNPNAEVHLVEPDSALATYLNKEVESRSLVNVKVHSVAVFDIDTTVTLRISELGDKGTSSLLPFNKSVIESDAYWSSRSDLCHVRTEEVAAVRLDTLFESCGVSNVDFVKIDVQGLDLDVLASAGEYLKVIRGGMLEVPALSYMALYEGEKQSLKVAFDRLDSMGFQVVTIKPNDPACNEFNVFFARSLDDWPNLVEELGLEGISAFDGKNYWHRHSNSPQYSDPLIEEITCENNRLISRIEVLDLELLHLQAWTESQDLELLRLRSRVESQDLELLRLQSRIQSLDLELLRLS